MTVISVRYGKRLHLISIKTFLTGSFSAFIALLDIFSTVAYVEAGWIQVVVDVLC